MTRFNEIAQNLAEVRERIAASAKISGRSADDITVIAVTKTFPVSDVEILKELGIHDFGENRDSDGAEKAGIVPARWHFQGQIQSNKIKSICRWSHVIHSLDDARHFEIIEKSAAHPLDLFLQVSLDGADNRGGANYEALYLLAGLVQASSIHRLMGLMAVAPLGQSAAQAFASLAQIHQKFITEFNEATCLSAGMSGDFEEAIVHGATHVRIGSSILGSR
ncbi:MAG: YggS family pyridoxal phosphate-dependent enzyme [Candidatus Planktophila sp.]